MAVKLEVILGLKNAFSSGWNKAEGDFKRGVRNMRASWNTLITLPNVLAAATPVLITKNLIDASMQMEALEAKMKSALPTFGQSERELNYVSQEADRMGINFQKLAQSYSMFAASSTRVGISLKDTRKIFKDFSEVTTALKLRPEQVSGVFLALEQMASKGKPQLQELKLQLGQYIPGAVELGAQAMGISVDKFLKKLQKGEITSREFLKKYAETVRSELGAGFDMAAKQTQASLNRINNEWFKLRVSLGKMFSKETVTAIDSITGGLKALNEHTAALKAGFETLTTPIVIVWNELQNMGVAIGYVFDATSSLITMVLIPLVKILGFVSDSAKVAGQQLYYLIRGDFAGATKAGAGDEGIIKRIKEIFDIEKALLENSSGMWEKWNARADKNYQDMADKMAKAYLAIRNASKKTDIGSSELIEGKGSKIAPDQSGGMSEKELKKWDAWIEKLQALSEREAAELHKRHLAWLAFRESVKREDEQWEAGKIKWEEDQAKLISDAYQQSEEARINIIESNSERELALLEFKYLKEREQFKGNRIALLHIEDAYITERNALTRELNKQQIASALSWVNIITDSFMTIAGETKEFTGLYKTAAIIQIIADTMSAAQSAYSSMVKSFGTYGIPAGIAAAAVVSAAGIARATMVANQKFAFGTRTFRTNGPQMITVGDNPGYRERVTVTPESSQNVNGPTSGSGGGTFVANFYDYSGGLVESFRSKIRAGGEADRLVRDILSRGKALGALV